jgi:zinc transport system substrate-binding protein
MNNMRLGRKGKKVLKKLIIIGLMGIYSCIYANVSVVVSVLPQKTFVEAIGGDKVNLTLMVLPGNSPHTYEPKPSQMQEIAKADIYFALDVEFEKVWLPKFASSNSKMKIVDVDEGIEKMPVAKDRIEQGAHKEHHDHKGLDPHIWTSPSNVRIIAKNIYEALKNEDVANVDFYKANYERFLAHIDETDKQIKNILADSAVGTKFMVFHPAWGYFAREYGLIQLAIESGGKNPKPKQVVYLIKEAKEEGVKAVFTAPEFSEKSAKQIALEVGVPVVQISPLNPQWSENLINLAKAIAHQK